MDYWLDLFTGTTWDEFREAGARVSGFREKMRKPASRVKSGDVLLCYLTGVQRWVGALEVVGPSSDTTAIWKHAEFPVRYDVKPLVVLDPEHGVPMENLEGKVDFYAGPEYKGKFKGFVRMSPNRFKAAEDAQLIMKLLREAEEDPVARPVDEKKLRRMPLFSAERKKGRTVIPAVVSVPESDETAGGKAAARTAEVVDEEAGRSKHTEIQYHLLKLGAEMGLDVWVARNDRSRRFRGRQLGGMPNMVSELPTQFNEATNRTVELIDVLWLRGNSIVAAFEVECTTSIYSGLLRMSDLLALQPNLEIKLYLAAPDDRREKVEQEILRPTFSLRERPLPDVCGFLPFSTLLEKVEGIEKLGLAASLKPDFLEATAEYFGRDGA